MLDHSPLLSEVIRPKSLADLTLPASLTSSLERMLERRTIQNLLFYGKPGIGKTSAARILLREIDADAYELNGSFNKGDKTMLNDIEVFSSHISLEGRPKVCFIDEADYLSKEVQASLRYMIEKFSRSTRFLLTANDVERLSPAIRSRCNPICFDVFPTEVSEIIDRMIDRYTKVLNSLGHSVEHKRLREIVALNFPDLRNIANRIELELI